jgi:para-aminobenzoate synthetase / 4-amino-4-deoxychorismate lyase
VAAGLDAIEDGVRDGLYAAGFFAYEFGYLLEPTLISLLPPDRDVPLIWMGLFRHVEALSGGEATAWLRQRAGGEHSIRNLRLLTERESYRKAFARVHAYLAAGDVYQVNLTLRYLFDFEGDAVALYLDLRRRQRVGHGAVIWAPDFHVLSLSPELFIRLDGRHASVRPMKGTAARGNSPEEDARQRTWLAGDEKSRAENLMIVDLMRNDLGRLAPPGGVRVTDLFTVETLRSLHQMTSGIEADLRDNVGLSELLRAIFPCGSVTGAPKIRAMQIIRELETRPRGVYTGAIGLIEPDGRAVFNVAIRTLVVHADGRGEMGVGSGVVFDSDADAEFDECLLKADFAWRPMPALGLIETMRWDRGHGYHLLDRHLARLKASAAYFAIPLDLALARAALSHHESSFAVDCCRVRLVLSENGEIVITAEPLRLLPAAVLRYVISDRPVCSDDPLVYHKTTRRAFYEAELSRLCTLHGCDEVLFVNERGELTEGSWTNLFVKRDGKLLTPPVACGLLSGTLRCELLETRPEEVEEAMLRPQDLAQAEAVLLGNSVRGLMAAVGCEAGAGWS